MAEQRATFLSRVGQRVANVALLLVAVGTMYFASRCYSSQYALVSARLGEKSLGQYEALVKQSLDYDPSNGRARAELAAYLVAQKKYDDGIAAQKLSMRSYRPLESYEQLGRIEERLAEQGTTDTRQSHAAAARDYFEEAERVRPGNITALEHLMVLAYRANDNEKAEQYAADLEKADFDNPNAIYVRALLAERQQNYRAAYGLYQRIASIREVPKSAFFTAAVVQDRLKQLRSIENF